jgi:hypothetical protein
VVGNGLHGHDGVAFDEDDGARHALGDGRAPVALHAEVADVADDPSRALCKRRDDFFGRPLPDAEADAARGEAFFGFAQAFEHEPVVPAVRTGELRQRNRQRR